MPVGSELRQFSAKSELSRKQKTPALSTAVLCLAYNAAPPAISILYAMKCMFSARSLALLRADNESSHDRESIRLQFVSNR